MKLVKAKNWFSVFSLKGRFVFPPSCLNVVWRVHSALVPRQLMLYVNVFSSRRCFRGAVP